MSEEQQVNELDRLASKASESVEGDYIPGEEAELGGGASDAGVPPESRVLAEMMVGLTFGFLQKRGEHWALQEDEESQLTGALSKTIDYYFDDASMSPPMALAVAAGMIAVPRLAMDAVIKKQEGGEGGDKQE